VTKRKVKEELKRPDILLATIGHVAGWVREHVRLCVIGLVVLVAAALAVTGYRMYQASQDEKIQYELAAAMRSFQEFAMNGSDDALKKAESGFKSLSTSHTRDVSDIARLYLGKIYYSQGKTEDAKALYLRVKDKSPDATLRKIAEAALQIVSQPAR
jgi:predicted negative regulator of RcsB-dependent stress response